jgi:hypothetical protein
VPSLSPEGFSGLAQCFITRQAEIVEQMLVIGDLAQRDALILPVEPAPPSASLNGW